MNQTLPSNGTDGGTGFLTSLIYWILTLEEYRMIP